MKHIVEVLRAGYRPSLVAMLSLFSSSTHTPSPSLSLPHSSSHSHSLRAAIGFLSLQAINHQNIANFLRP